MSEMVIEYATLSLSQQVLERQHTHAEAIADYLPAHADIGDSTGALLSLFDPLSQAAVEIGVQAARALAGIEQAAAGAVGDTALDVADHDGKVADAFTHLAGRLGAGGAAASYPDLGGPTLGPAGSAAEAGHGGVEGNVFTKARSIGETIGGTPADGAALVEQVSQWGRPGTVSELSDASSYLVPGQAPENFVQDLRWSAGLLLGSIDWVAEQFCGFSILQRCVYGPLAGDWQGIYRCSEAWKHAGEAADAIAHNHAGLVAATPATWEGLSGNSFRLMMTTLSGATLGLSTVYGTAAGYVQTVSTVCKLACTAIGFALNQISTILLEMAAEAAVPVIGWAVGAATLYSKVNKVIGLVRLVYTALETVTSAIQDFVEAKTGLLDKLALLEDLLQGAVASAAA